MVENQGGVLLPSELELMEIHVNVLFRQNDAGLITVVNEPPFDIAPRLFLGVTKGGHIHKYRNGLDPQLVKELEAAIGAAPGDNLAEIIELLSRDRKLTRVDFGPAYRFAAVTNRFSEAVQITTANRELLRPHFPYTFEELDEKLPCFAIVQDGIAVSICCSARQTPAAAEASLATLEPFRGRGYGVQAATAWAAEVQRQGRIALYSTAWDNLSSQTVARKLQLIQYGTDITID